MSAPDEPTSTGRTGTGGSGPTIRRLARRAGWNVVDQALVSLSSLLMSVLVARAVSPEDFGAFTLAFTVYAIGVLLSRALTSQPMLIRFADAVPEAWRVAAGRSTGTGAVLGFTLGVAALATGFLTPGTLGPALKVLLFVLPGLLMQDAWRMAFFAQGRPARAALADGTWVFLQVVGVVALTALGADSAVPYLLVWGSAATAAAALAAWKGRALPKVTATRGWLKEHWDLTRFLVLETSLLQGAYHGALLLVGALGTLAGVGALRGAQVILGPVALLATSAFAFAVPELSRRRTTLSPRRRVIAAMLISGALASAALAWGTVTLLLPQGAGEALLGESWSGVRSLLLAVVIGQVGNLLSAGAYCVLYSMGRADLVFRVSAVLAGLIIGGGVGGVLLGGAPVAAIGIAGAYWIALPLWWWLLVRANRAPVGHA